MSRSSSRVDRSSLRSLQSVEAWEDRLHLRLTDLEERIVQLFREQESRLSHARSNRRKKRRAREDSDIRDTRPKNSGVDDRSPEHGSMTGQSPVPSERSDTEKGTIDVDLDDSASHVTWQGSPEQELASLPPEQEAQAVPSIVPGSAGHAGSKQKRSMYSVAKGSYDTLGPVTPTESNRRSGARLAANHMRASLADIALSMHDRAASSSPAMRFLQSNSIISDQGSATNATSPRSWLRSIVCSWPFELGSALMALGTLVTMSIALQIKMAKWAEDVDYQNTNIAELVFVFAFVVEVALRAAALGRPFLHNRLNVLDVVLAILSVAEQILFWFQEGMFANPMFLRILRYVRLLKLARVSRVISKSRDVRVMLHLLSFSLRTFVFILASVIIIIYIAAFMLMSGVEETLQSYREDPNNPVATSLVQQWGSLGLSMQSLYMAVTGGIQWKEISDPLAQGSSLWLVFFLIFIAFFLFIVFNLIIAMTVHKLFEATNNLDQMLVNMRMEARLEIRAKLQEFFPNQDMIEWHDFLTVFGSEELQHLVHHDFDLTISEFEQFVYRLSACGEQAFDLDSVVTGAIQLRSIARKVDLMELHRETRAFFKNVHNRSIEAKDDVSDTSLDSLDGKHALNIEPVPASSLPQRLDAVIDAMKFGRQEKEELSETAAAVFSAALAAEGGCGFVVTSKAGYLSLQQRRIDFQVVDRSDEFPHGYMSGRLKGLHIADPDFLEAVKDFSLHTDSDKWDAGPGKGLSKDGYFLLGLRGETFKAAVRLAGMPTPPFRWDGVGTRHLAAMSACWSLRHHASVVIVRSDSGNIHTLAHQGGKIVVFKTKVQCVSIFDDAGIDV